MAFPTNQQYNSVSSMRAHVNALCSMEIQKHWPEVVPVVGMFSLFARSLLWQTAEGV